MNKNLQQLRTRLDVIDENILLFLAQRLKLAQAIGKEKQKLQLPPLDLQRKQEALLKRISIGQRLGLEERTVKTLYECLHDLAVEFQNKNEK